MRASMLTQSPLLRVLLVGESWVSYSHHLKGFNFFPTAYYEEGYVPLRAALEGFVELVHLPGHLAATDFPASLNDLRSYRVVLFSDVGADTLLLHPDTFLRAQVNLNRLSLVAQYVEQGGGFGMIGGYMSFGGYEGRAHYWGTPIEEILPVSILPHDDRVEKPEGVRPEIVDGAHPILEGIGRLWPPLLGYNRVLGKENAHIVLRCGEDPLLVTGSFGRGRTLAYTSDMSPHWGSQAFISWEHYPRFWRQLVAWLAGVHP